MSKYRNALPQLADRIFLTDGGLETTLIFQDGLDLPHFASFPLIDTEEGRHLLESYYESYARIALKAKTGFMLDTATWRANPDWAAKLGYAGAGLDDVNRRCVEHLIEMRDRYENPETPMVVSGAIGPRGDGYIAGDTMTTAEAEGYHAPQINALASAGVDLVSALTITYAEEAAGIAAAAARIGIPVAVSFTLETDGKLPSGQALADAVAQVDGETASAPVHYMVNCAHPTHFEEVLADGGLERVRGLRANASMKRHAELDEAEELDQGDPADLAERYRELRPLLPNLTVVGGCCGTDERHIEAICAVWT